uniref:pyridoxal-phosphate dependent enzyme n=1 Tax=Enterococcus faecium TaxID=1352 RepID=UPI0034E98A9F
MIVSDIKELIGKTPIFQFLATDYGGESQSRIYAKLEYLNPGGSIKDRLGSYLISEAVAAGRITKDTTVIEPTTGNTGI